jgi:hypothetical protein
MQTRYDATQDQYLHVQLEVAPGVALTRPQKTKIRKIIISVLLGQNSEYRELVRIKTGEGNQEDVYPDLEYLPYGDSAFKPGAKLAAAAKVSAK